MAIFEITTFAKFAGLLLAARKLAQDTDPLNRLKALTDLASNTRALNAAVRDTDLTPLAREMERAAQDAINFTHPGPMRDDAEAIFWQAAPEALSDPNALAAANLDPQAACDAMVAAIKASPNGPDFTATQLAEPYFRAVTMLVLQKMLADPAFVTTLTPTLWRETLTRHGIQISLLENIDATTRQTGAKVDALEARIAELTAELTTMREAQEARETGVSEKALIRLVRPIAEDVEDSSMALIELANAVSIAARVQREGYQGSNLGDFVDEVLRRRAALSAEGEHQAAIREIEQALAREEAESQARKLRLLNAAIDEHLLARDPEGAAQKIAGRVKLETSDQEQLFNALRKEQGIWYKRGRDKGLRLDLEVARSISRRTLEQTLDTDQRGAVLNDLGKALAIFGQRGAGTEHLNEAIDVYHEALKIRTRERVPLDWARTQNNLGVALAILARRKSGTRCIKRAIDAFRQTLNVWTRDRVPLDWAMTQNNLGAALWTLGERESGTEHLEEAVEAYQEALKERTRDRAPLLWAATQNNLGNVLKTLGERVAGTEHLQNAVNAFRAALRDFDRLRAPLQWATIQSNLGDALQILGEREKGTERLSDAITAYREALSERPRNRLPLDWALATGGQGVALALLADRTSDLSTAQRALDQLKQAEAVSRDAGHIPLADKFAALIPETQSLVARLPGNPET